MILFIRAYKFGAFNVGGQRQATNRVVSAVVRVMRSASGERGLTAGQTDRQTDR